MSTKPHTPIDWSDLLERTRLGEKAVLEAGVLSADQRDRILRARAEFLASPLRIEHEADATHSVAVIRSGVERYAMPLHELVEVIRQPKIALVPHAPEFVAGLVQVRGEIRPVYHLPALLGHGSRGRDIAPMVVLARAGAVEFGIGVDAVEDVRQVPIEGRVPTLTSPGRAGWMTDDLIPCLDANTLMPQGS